MPRLSISSLTDSASNASSTMATANTPPTVALIVPVWRDSAALCALLDAAADWTPPPDHIVVVAGEPDETVARVCAERGHTYLDTAPCRGAQLDRGTRVTDADVLWFMHADCVAPPTAVAAIRRALAAGAESGCFRFSFRGKRAWHKTLLERLVALRVRLGGIPYGDQALFATRSAYLACGGFAHQRLFEEVRLVRRLRRRRSFVVLPEKVATSPKRWERDGWLARTLHNRWLALLHALGVPAERLAAVYYGPRPGPKRTKARKL